MYNALIFYGPSGCGKSTLASFCAKKWNLPFLEGDDYHSPTNRLKMQEGIPLTDEDRIPWLASLRVAIQNQIATNCCIVSCSALTQGYRELLSQNVNPHWVLPAFDRETLSERLNNRRNHFFNPGLLQSQLDLFSPAPNGIQLPMGLTLDESLIWLQKQVNPSFFVRSSTLA